MLRPSSGNPVCGDQILLTARIDGDAVSDIAFEAFGCSASLAIASILTERLTGLTVPEVAAVTTDQVLQWSGVESRPAPRRRIGCRRRTSPGRQLLRRAQ